MPQRLGGQLVDGGDPVADEPVFVVDTGPADEGNWSIVATDRSAGDGSWSVTVPSTNPERYHAVAQFEESGTLKNALSKPFLTSQPFAQPGLVTVGFDVLSPRVRVTGPIPDSVVSRPADEGDTSVSEKHGLQINSDAEWPSIGAQISSQTTGATTAYIHRVSDGVLMGQTDISGLSAGDTFVIDDVNLSPNTDYNFVLDDGGNSFTIGFLGGSSADYPYTSDDGDLRIIDGAKGETGIEDNNAATGLVSVGDEGF